MSNQEVRGVVLAHGQMAQGLIDAAHAITGSATDCLTAISNKGMGPDALADKICEIAGDEPVIVFTDLLTGSCGFAARRCTHDHPNLAVISGVNLPMLLEFVTKRKLPLAELVPLVLKKGQGAICCSPSTFEANEHRAVSRG